MGEPDKVALRAALEAAGWAVERVDSDEWWIDEAWRLTSTWRPQTATAHVTFIVNPDSQSGDVSDVWYVAVTAHAPRERLEQGRPDINVRPWPDRLREIVAAAAALRPQV